MKGKPKTTSPFLYRKHIFIIGLALSMTVTVMAKIVQDVEYLDNVKAAFIYHFTKYIKWPDLETSDTFQIVVFGDLNIIHSLEQISQTKTINGKKVAIRQTQDIRDIMPCHILFIPESGKTRLQQIIRNMDGSNTLLISETAESLTDGIMINFVIIAGKLKFEINMAAMKKAGIHPSSQLLKLAVSVKN